MKGLTIAVLWLCVCVLSQHNPRTREIAAVGTVVLLVMLWSVGMPR